MDGSGDWIGQPLPTLNEGDQLIDLDQALVILDAAVQLLSPAVLGVDPNNKDLDPNARNSASEEPEYDFPPQNLKLPTKLPSTSKKPAFTPCYIDDDDEDDEDEDDEYDDDDDDVFDASRVRRSALTFWEGTDKFFEREQREKSKLEQMERNASWKMVPIVQPADQALQNLEVGNDWSTVDNFYGKLKATGYKSIAEFNRSNKYLTSFGKINPYNEEVAQKKYLDSKPTCFIILGMPLNANRNLAKRIGDYWGCIVIDAETVLKDELANNPDGVWGNWINLSLREGRAITNDMVFQLMFEKMHSPAARHSGYVMVGVPTIPSGSAMPGREDPALQMQRIMQSQMYPDVLIYVKSNTSDVIFTRSKLFCDTTTGIEIDFHMINQCHQKIRRFSPHEDNRQEPYYDKWEEYEQERNKFFETSPMMQCFVNLHHNSPSVLEPALEYYNTHIRGVIEYAILTHDQDLVVKLDGRTPSFRMMQVLKAKLDTLPLLRVYPVILLSKELEGRKPIDAEGEAPEVPSLPTENLDDVGEDKAKNIMGDDPEQAFATLCERFKPGERFRWRWSSWGKRCPVTSTKFNDVTGKVEFACRFLDKIYFLASEEASKVFIANPRPYLKVEEECLPDRIFIAGPPRSGKTTLANYYAEILDTKVFDMEAIEADLLDSMAVQKASFNEALLIGYTEELTKKEAILHAILDVYLHIKSVVQFIKNHSNILNMRSAVARKNRARKIPIRDLVFKKEWFEEFMAKEPVPTMPIYCATKQKHADMIDKIKTDTNNPIANEYVLSERERANALAEKIREYLRVQIVDEAGNVVSRPKSWVVDNAPLRRRFWVCMYGEKIIPNRIIYLLDEKADYNFLMSKFTESDLYLKLNFRRQEDVIKAAEELAVFEARGKKAREARRAALEALEAAQREAEEDAKALEKELQGDTGEKTASSLTYGLGSPFPVTESEMELKRKVSRERAAADLERMSLIEQEVRNTSLSSSELIYTNRRLWSASAVLHSVQLPLQSEYEAELERLEKEWAELQSLIVGKAKIDTVVINDLTLSGLLDVAKQHTNVALVPQARKKTPEELAAERKLEVALSRDFGDREDDVLSDDAIRAKYFKVTSVSSFGETFKCCPVIYGKGGFLTPGKEEFSCVYRDKTYWMSNRYAEEEFLANPSKYAGLHRAVNHISYVPRICIVGPMGCGKTELAKNLALAFKCNYYNFDELMEKEFMGDLDYKIGRKYEEKRVREELGLPVSPMGDYDYSKSFEDLEDEDEESAKSAESQDMGDIFTNNNLMKKALRDYLVLGKSIPYPVLDKVVADKWYSEPNATEGFVMDGFPSRPFDIEYMESRCIRPNLIIHMESDSSVALTRVFLDVMDIWYARQDQLRAQLNLDTETSSPMQTLIDRNSDSDNEGEDEVEDREAPIEEDEVGEEEELNSPKQSVLEPEFFATRRVVENIKHWVDEDIQFFETLRAYAAAENIGWDSFGAGTDRMSVLQKGAIAALTTNCLELYHRIHEFSLVRYLKSDEAQNLLESGYLKLSKFGYWCPVQMSMQDSFFPAMRPNFERGPFPVAYRNYIYYLGSPKNLFLFEMNPEEYVRRPANLPLVNLRIAVQGPPLSGKTELCKRLAAEFGLLVVAPGDAVRYVLVNLQWTELAKSLKEMCQEGRVVNPILLAEAISSYIMSEKGASRGYVLDGYPHTIDDAKAMEMYGINPCIMFYLDDKLQVALDRVKEGRLHISYEGIERFYSKEHMEYKVKNFYARFPYVCKWYLERFQNVYAIDGSISKWNLFYKTKRLITHHYMEMFSYGISYRDVPHNLSSMCVTPQEFVRRSAPTSNYCIVCWVIKYQLVTEGFPPPAHGVIQYKDKYYYVCQAHQQEFLLHPEDYVNVEMDRKAPQLPSPTAVDTGDKLYANGLCIVTFVNHKKPYRVIGKESLAVKYGEYVYLFANKTCQTQFLENPELYCGRNMRYQETMHVEIDIPPILPLGYVEQKVSRIVNAAVSCCVEFRPSLGRVNMGMYASVYVGLQLLVRNPDTDQIIKRWANEQITKYHKNGKFVKTVFGHCRLLMKKTTKDFLN